jgi:hypothetical protein
MAASSPPSSSPRTSRKRVLDPEFGAFIEKVLDPASNFDDIRSEAGKVQKKQEPIPFAALYANRTYTLGTIGLSELKDFELPRLPEPNKAPSSSLKDYIARIRKHWHLSSSENTTRTLIDVILLEVLRHLPADKSLDVWGEVDFPRRDDSGVFRSVDYVLGPPSLEDTPAKGRYVIVVEAKKALGDHDRVQAFGEMKAALEKNRDGLTVYGVLTDSKEWCVLSLGPDLVPRISLPMQLGVQPKYADAQLSDLINVLYAVFVTAVSQAKKWCPTPLAALDAPKAASDSPVHPVTHKRAAHRHNT